jgi:uncharacterized protein with von Willebrand factor type A (vWA) domain
MRLFHALLLLPLFGAPALAQSVTPAAAEHHGRRSAEDHFADANTTHDGHLTLDQATAGYKSIAKSFNQIDVSHHGYVTLDDIKAWKAAKKAARQAAKHAATDASDAAAGIVRPVPASQRWLGPKATDTSTDMVAPAPAGQPRTGVDLPRAPLDGDRSS